MWPFAGVPRVLTERVQIAVCAVYFDRRKVEEKTFEMVVRFGCHYATQTNNTYKYKHVSSAHSLGASAHHVYVHMSCRARNHTMCAVQCVCIDLFLSWSSTSIGNSSIHPDKCSIQTNARKIVANQQQQKEYNAIIY